MIRRSFGRLPRILCTEDSILSQRGDPLGSGVKQRS